ncbi:xylulokinase [Thalassospira mesophila]|uniref:Xylulose kinase n=1 Tax=Thalassospira mesophila TaxID=1293891 RepID=A0A1Y2L4M4_9PROT|nr:xylulokinase [Thalassospira mesophila]OSQ40762.1 xylulose kinase [Thalassospira mesophila]
MFMGIDVGTSAVKALLMDDTSTIVAEADIALSLSNPHPYWSEQNPADWWEATLQAIDLIMADNASALAQVRAIGLSGQMHGAVVLGADDTPLRPAILWNDGRAKAECDELEAALPGLALRAGVVAMPGMTAPKIMWLRKHEPDVFEAVRTILLPKDYIRLHLCGEKATEMSDAAGTLWLDEETRAWNPDAIAATGLNADQLPPLFEGSDATGTLRPELAARWGMGKNVVIAGGGGDAATGGIGAGAVTHGDGFISLGTSSQLFVASDRYRPKPELLLHSFAHAVPDRWFQMAVLLNGASCLAWVAKMLGETNIADLLARTEAQHKKPSDLMFLPYLSGERTPHNNPYARGVFFGLGTNTTRDHMVQAVLEGVAFALADAQSCLHAAGTHCALPGVIGGGARSLYWTQMIADIMGTPLARYQGGAKGPAFGAARLARLAVKDGTIADVCTPPVIENVLKPDAHRHEQYLPRMAKFRRLYDALADEFQDR